MLPVDAPPVLGFHSHRSRIEHKLEESRYFYDRLSARDVRYKKLSAQKNWKRASSELNEWMYCASAFISATRSVYYYLMKATKTNSTDRLWLKEQQALPIHEIGTQLRDFLLHEATPDTGFQVELPEQRAGESRGEWVVRGLMQQPKNAVIRISVTDLFPQLSPEAVTVAKGFNDDGTKMLTAIFRAVERLIGDADGRGMLTDAVIGSAVSTKRRA